MSDEFKLKKQDKSFNILVTTSCNIRCKYCYETQKDSKVIKFEYAKKFLKYILKNSLKKGIERVGVKLMGGEVLQFPKLLTNIVEYGEKLFLSHGIFIMWFFSTNGTSYQIPGVMEFIKKYYKHFHIKNISFDGSPINHDKHRIYHDGTGSAAEILKNWDEISPYMNRLSYDTDPDFNYVLSTNSLDTFADDILWHSKYMSPIINIIPQDSGIYLTDEHIGIVKEQLSKAYEIKNKEFTNGIIRPISFLLKKKNQKNHIDCYLSSRCCNDLEIAVDPDGNILPCVGLNYTIFGNKYVACHVNDLKLNTNLFNKVTCDSKEYLDKLGSEKKGGLILCMARYMEQKEYLPKSDFTGRAKLINTFIDFNNKMKSLYGVYF